MTNLPRTGQVFEVGLGRSFGPVGLPLLLLQVGVSDEARG